jgi:AcrR family transcriptional regulator
VADVKRLGGAVSRRDQAERTRKKILDSAYDLFCAVGYEAATMQQVAAAADVSVQSVYLNFRTKARLLSEVENRVILGDQPEERWREQPWLRAIREETDARKLIDLFVDVDTDIKGRIAPFVAAVGAPMLSNDPARVSARDRGRDEFFEVFIDRLADLDALRSDLTATRALDIVRAVDTAEAFIDLTIRRGWTAAEWSSWLKRLLAQQLLS